MADTVTGPQILQENDNRATIKLVVESDGTGGTTVFGDVSAMDTLPNGTTCKTLSVQRLWFACDTGDEYDSHQRCCKGCLVRGAVEGVHVFVHLEQVLEHHQK